MPKNTGHWIATVRYVCHQNEQQTKPVNKTNNKVIVVLVLFVFCVVLFRVVGCSFVLFCVVGCVFVLLFVCCLFLNV